MQFKLLITSWVVISFVFFLLVSKPVLAVDEAVSPPPEKDNTAACLAREKEVKGRMTRLESLARDMQLKFDEIANRVELYYTSYGLPNGKLVPEYSKLVTEIQVSRSAVLIALNNTRNDVDSFNCGEGQPKVKLNKFKNGMQEVKSSLKKYRTAVKNLIVAVRSARSITKPTKEVNANE